MTEEMIIEAWKEDLRRNDTDKLKDMVKNNVKYAKKYLDQIAYYCDSSSDEVHWYIESLNRSILTIKVLNEIIDERR